MQNKPADHESKSHGQKKNKSVFREYAEAIFIALLLALFIRTFIIQAFKIPSGSMEKTLLIGDHILVSKTFLNSSRKAYAHPYAHCKKVNCQIASSEQLGIDFNQVSDHCPLGADL